MVDVNANKIDVVAEIKRIQKSRLAMGKRKESVLDGGPVDNEISRKLDAARRRRRGGYYYDL